MDDVAGMFCIGFDGLTPSRQVLDLIDRGVGGVVLFSRNFESPAQVRQLCAVLKRRADRPLLIAVDHEGGRVQRFRDGFTPVGPMRSLGQSADEHQVEQLGRTIARELRGVHVDLNFAPVVDVDTNPANPVIGDRSFGADPAVVSRLARALIRGMQAQGIAACAKHFPGHGDTSQDSHLDLPRLPHDMARLQRVELPPFRAACEAGVASIMTAHVMFEALDRQYPATMSRPCLDGILRDRWGYDGVVISDDLEMRAISDHYGLEEAVVRGAGAGVDLFLVCHSPDVQSRAIELLSGAVRRGAVHGSRIAEAARRVSALKARFVRPAAEAAPTGNTP